MKQFTPVILIAFLLFSGCVNQSVKQKDKPAKIIFDTDLGPDYDNVGFAYCGWGAYRHLQSCKI